MASSIPDFTLLVDRLAVDLEWLAALEPDVFEAVVDAMQETRSMTLEMLLLAWTDEDEDEDEDDDEDLEEIAF